MLKEVEPKEALREALEGETVYQIYEEKYGEYPGLAIKDVACEMEQILARFGSRFLVDKKEPEEAPEKPVRKKEPSESKIDKGKIKALHDAGWTNAKIADEMGVSAPTVAKYIAKAEEEKEADHGESNIDTR